MQNVQISVDGQAKKVDIVNQAVLNKGLHIDCLVDGSRKLHIVKTVKGAWMEQADDMLKPSLIAELIGRQLDKKDNTIVNDDTFLLRLSYEGREYKLSVTPLKNRYRIVEDGDFLFDLFPPDHLNDHWHAGGQNVDPHFAEAVGLAIAKY